MNKKDYFDAVSEIRATPSLKRAIITKMLSRQVRRRPSLKVMAAVCVALSLVLISSILVYAGVIDFTRIYRIIFGHDSEIIQQYIEPIGGVENANNDMETAHADAVNIHITEEEMVRKGNTESVCDGISIRLVSVLHGAGDLRIFATATDLTGDRLDKETRFDDWGLSEGHGGNISVVDYDEATRTASLMITSLGENLPGEASLRINSFINGRKFCQGVIENGLNFYDLLKDRTPGLMAREQVWSNGGSIWMTGGAFSHNEAEKLAQRSGMLKPNELSRSFSSINWCTISNVGFVDGSLHIQTKILPGCENDLASIDFVNQNAEVVYQGHFSLSFADIREVGEGDAHQHDVIAQYKEMIYEEVTDVEQLKGLSVVIDYLREGTTTTGEWAFSFQIPDKAVADINIFNDLVINGKAIRPDKISISPLGVTFYLPENIAASYIRNDTLQVLYENGEAVYLEQTVINGYEDTSALSFSGQIIDAERVRNIVLNGEVIKVIADGLKSAEK